MSVENKKYLLKEKLILFLVVLRKYIEVTEGCLEGQKWRDPKTR